MTEEQARDWIAARFSAASADRVGAFLAMVAQENDRQNLIAPSTVSTIWQRHALDSAQLLPLAGSCETWLDIGTGGGFPGIVIALLGNAAVTMVEPRRRRVDFLRACVDRLGLANARIFQANVEKVTLTADVISARAVGSVEKLLQAAAHCATPNTRWILPRGTIDPATMAMLDRNKMVFHVEHSLTDPASMILVIGGDRR